MLQLIEESEIPLWSSLRRRRARLSSSTARSLAQREHRGSFVLIDQRNFFAIATHYEPLSPYMQSSHYWDLARMRVLPSLIARQGKMVFINSGAGFQPPCAGWAAYAASKHVPPIR